MRLRAIEQRLEVFKARVARYAQKLAVVACVSLIATSCYKTEMSAELSEPGRIEQMIFVPKGSGSGTTFTPGARSGGIGFTSVTIPEHYGVVISCMHGQFTLDGETARGVFTRFKQGDSITIRYREVYVVRDSGERELYDLDFVAAVAR